MDTKILIENVRRFFREIDCGEKTYSQAWLSEIDFGGLHYGLRYALHVKSGNLADDCNLERRKIIHLLHEKSPEAYKLIWRIWVYGATEQASHYSDDLLLFDESTACTTA